MTVSIIIVLAIVACVFITADVISRKVIFPHHRTLQMSEDIVKDEDEWRDYDKKDTEELNFTLSDGYLIHGTMVWNDRNSKKFIIHTHGFRFTRYGGIKYLNTFFNSNYNVYLYDLRSHGENERGPVGMGETESKDLSDIIKQFRAKFGDDITLGLHGESLGAFTSLVTLKYEPKVDFVIEDCAYSDTIQELKYQMSRQHMPSFMFNLVVWIARTKYKMHWEVYDAKDIIKDSELPIMFIHGDGDMFTPSWMASSLYNACNIKYNKKLLYFEGAKHANSEKSNPNKYIREVTAFIKTNGF